MPKNSKTQTNAQISLIRRMLEDTNNTDTKIIERLKLPPSTYYRYKSKIYAIDRELWMQVARESFEARALKIMRSLEYAIKVNEKICEDPETEARDKRDSAKAIVECHCVAYQFLEKGPQSNVIKVLPK